jgi:hypothetical protein
MLYLKFFLPEGEQLFRWKLVGAECSLRGAEWVLEGSFAGEMSNYKEGAAEHTFEFSPEINTAAGANLHTSTHPVEMTGSYTNMLGGAFEGANWSAE